MRNSLALICLAMLCVPACQKRTAYGTAVELTIRADSNLADELLATVQSVRIDVSGVESYSAVYPVGHLPGRRDERWIYLPGARDGELVFSVRALSGLDESVGFGRSPAVMLRDGEGVSAFVIIGKQTVDPDGGMPPECPSVPANVADLYVDAAAPLGGNGTLTCPFRTISAGLAAADASTAPARVVHAAAGTYDAALGEVFPLTLRGATSLVGAGTSTTIVRGLGAVDRSIGGGPLTGNYLVTVLAGDLTATTSLARLTLESPSPTILADSYGVFCDRGNALPPADPPPTPLPPPSLVLEGVVIGPRYQVGVSATGSTVPTPNGCNLRMTGSTLSGNATGLWAVGCANTTVALQIGDGSPTGVNIFSNNKTGKGDGVGLLAEDCVSPIVVNDNIFENSEIGMSLRQRGSMGAGYAEVVANTFRNLTNNGLELWYTAIVHKLIGNSFVNVSPYGGLPGTGAALYLDSATELSPNGPKVKLGRANQFVGNQYGVLIRGNPISASSTPPRDDIDFGNDNNAGENSFSCNSKLAGAGFDLFLDLNAPSSATLQFQGNSWDRGPPSTSIAGAAAPNGTDLVTSAAATVNTSQYGPALTAQCMNAHIK